MMTLLKFFPALLLALFSDGLDIILAIIAVLGIETIIITIITIVINIVQSIFDLFFWIYIFIIGASSEVKKTIYLFRRIFILAVSFFAEVTPGINDIIGFIPFRVLSIVYIILEESGVLEKLEQKLASVASKINPLSRIPIVAQVAQRLTIPSLPFVSSFASQIVGATGPQIISQRQEEVSSESPKKISLALKKPNNIGSQIISERNINQEENLTKPQIKTPKGQLSLILLIFLIFPFFALAQTNKVLFNYQTLDNNQIVITAVFINPKTKTVFTYSKSYYNWELGGGIRYSALTSKPILIADLPSNLSTSKIDIKLTVNLPNLKKEVYFGSIELNKPDVAIIKKVKNYFELPFLGSYQPRETIYAKPYNFSSNNLSFTWYLNDIYLSNSPSIDSSSLKTGYLIVKIKNLNNFLESASDFLIIK